MTLILTANINLPDNTFKELITNAKSNTNKINCGYHIIGSMNQLIQVALDEQVGITMMHAPNQFGRP